MNIQTSSNFRLAPMCPNTHFSVHRRQLAVGGNEQMAVEHLGQRPRRGRSCCCLAAVVAFEGSFVEAAARQPEAALGKPHKK